MAIAVNSSAKSVFSHNYATGQSKSPSLPSGSGLARLATKFFAARAKSRQIKSDIERLSQYDDHQLKDIGINRHDIERIVRGNS